MKVFKHSVSVVFVLLTLLGCRREVEERPVFPSAEYFAPSVITSSANQIIVHGINLEGASATIGGQAATSVVSEDKKTLTVSMPVGISDGSYNVSVTLNDESIVSFPAPLVIDAAETAFKGDMLIGDFDGNGIRSASTTSNFSDGAWNGNPGANSSMGITNSINGVTSSPAGGNFAYATVAGGGVLPNTYGYVGALDSRNEIRNDLVTGWPEGFLSYEDEENAALTYVDGFDDVSDFRINFWLNLNGTSRSQVRVNLGNSDLSNSEKYAKTILTTETSASVPGAIRVSPNGWNLVSIKLSDFVCNFGFGGVSNCTINDVSIQELNQISFGISDDFNNVYSSCCTGTTIDCCDEEIKEPVEAYIDHVTITKGAPAYDYSK